MAGKARARNAISDVRPGVPRRHWGLAHVLAKAGWASGVDPRHGAEEGGASRGTSVVGRSTPCRL